MRVRAQRTAERIRPREVILHPMCSFRSIIICRRPSPILRNTLSRTCRIITVRTPVLPPWLPPKSTRRWLWHTLRARASTLRLWTNDRGFTGGFRGPSAGKGERRKDVYLIIMGRVLYCFYYYFRREPLRTLFDQSRQNKEEVIVYTPNACNSEKTVNASGDCISCMGRGRVAHVHYGSSAHFTSDVLKQLFSCSYTLVVNPPLASYPLVSPCSLLSACRPLPQAVSPSLSPCWHSSRGSYSKKKTAQPK